MDSIRTAPSPSRTKALWERCARSWPIPLAVIACLVLTVGLTEHAMGRILICKTGQVLLWYGNTYGSGNSQHISDWYTFSHIIHGMLFYGLLWLVARRLPARTRLVLAVLIEGAWELAENSPFIIDRYRAVTAALDYTGDSILNSLSDILAMSFGFCLAYKFRPRWIVTLIVFLELFTLYTVRDNLTLNVVMLVHPVQAIKTWQLNADFVPPALKKP